MCLATTVRVASCGTAPDSRAFRGYSSSIARESSVGMDGNPEELDERINTLLDMPRCGA